MPYFFSKASAAGCAVWFTIRVVYQVTEPSFFAASMSAWSAAWAASVDPNSSARQNVGLEILCMPSLLVLSRFFWGLLFFASLCAGSGRGGGAPSLIM